VHSLLNNVIMIWVQFLLLYVGRSGIHLLVIHHMGFSSTDNLSCSVLWT